MTFVIAWKHEDRIYCVTDSAVTKPGPPSRPLSSFGEAHLADEKGTVVEEALPKIIPVSSTQAIAYAGSVHGAEEYIAVFRKLNNPDVPVATILKETGKEVSLPHGTGLNILLLEVANGEPQLHTWSAAKPEQVLSEISLVHFGSLDQHHRTLAARFVKLLIENGIAGRDIMPGLLAYLQSMGVYDALMKVKVGGAFFGASLSADGGFVWQDDISYVFYPADPLAGAIRVAPDSKKPDEMPSPTEGYDIVTCLVRDNVWVVSSSITHHPVFLAHTESLMMTLEQWRAKWEEDLREYFNSLRSRHYAFIHKLRNNVVVVTSPTGRPSTPHFEMQHVGNQCFSIKLAEMFVQQELLPKSIPEEVQPNSPRFRFMPYSDE